MIPTFRVRFLSDSGIDTPRSCVIQHLSDCLSVSEVEGPLFRRPFMGVIRTTTIGLFRFVPDRVGEREEFVIEVVFSLRVVNLSVLIGRYME